MPTKNPFKFLDVHTNKGAAHMVAGQAVGLGTPAQATLLTTGVFVDREVVTVGLAADGDDDIYEIIDLSTDSTVDILTFWNNVDREITQLAIDPADYAFVVGEYVATTLEIAIVTHIKVNSATDWDVSFYRGVAGTTIVAHVTGTDAIEVQEGTALTAGTIPLPMIGVTQAIGLAALAAIIGAGADGEGASERGPADYNGVVNDLTQLKQGQWRFINLDDVTGMLVSKVGGDRAVTVAITAGNNDWEAALTYGGVSASANVNMVDVRIPTAEEVAAGILFVPCNFKPESASVFGYVRSTDVEVAFDGTIVIDRTLNVVSIVDSGLVPFAEVDTAVISIQGRVEVADVAVIG
jgi:hypothetical protein